MPLRLTAGGSYKLSDAVRFCYAVDAASTWQGFAKWRYQINKNWMLSVRQQYSTKHIGTSRNPYDIGFEVAYKL